MSVIVSVQVHDGIVLAGDSSVIREGRSYLNAERLLAPLPRWPVGILIAGDSRLGAISLGSHLRSFQQAFLRSRGALRMSRSGYRMADFAESLLQWLKANITVEDLREANSALTLAGYSAQSMLGETWRLDLAEEPSLLPVWGSHEYGISWDGHAECLNRLVCGMSSELVDAAVEGGMKRQAAVELSERVGEACGRDLVTPGMPLQDALDLARFLIETTITYDSFTRKNGVARVGGPIDLAVITPHQGFRWVQRKRLVAAVVAR